LIFDEHVFIQLKEKRTVARFYFYKRVGRFPRRNLQSKQLRGLEIEQLVGSDQGKGLSLWGNSWKRRLFLALEWPFLGWNCRPDEELKNTVTGNGNSVLPV